LERRAAHKNGAQNQQGIVHQVYRPLRDLVKSKAAAGIRWSSRARLQPPGLDGYINEGTLAIESPSLELPALT